LDALALVRPALLPRRAPGGRHGAGVYYTPAGLAEEVVALVRTAPTPPGDPACPRVIDPACGCGNLLVPVLRAFLDARGVQGAARARLAASLLPQVAGLDTDRLAVEVARTRLAWEAGGDATGLRVAVGDGLAALADAAPAAWDVVVGNPPFLTRLRRDTALPPPIVTRVREVLALPPRATVDASALFLGLAARAVGAGGQVAMVQPASFLAGEGAAPIRRRLAQDGTVRAVWWPDARFAGASVQVVVIAWERGGPRHGTCAVGRGPRRPVPGTRAWSMDALADAPTWGVLAAEALGVPRVSLPAVGHGRTLGARARVEADYRDAFYGLVPAVREEVASEDSGRDTRRLLVTGHVDPARLRWGEVACRFARERLLRPVVDLAVLDGVDPTRAAWVRRRAVPRVVVATQGRVLEAAVDAEGAYVNVTPTITVVPHDPCDLWRLLAVLGAPCVSALLAARSLGAGLSPGALRVSAGAIRALPLPTDEAAWERAADAARVASHAEEPALHDALVAFGVAADAAYGVDDPATRDWWQAGIAPRRPGRAKPRR
jgi:predicted RNA methylase